MKMTMRGLIALSTLAAFSGCADDVFDRRAPTIEVRPVESDGYDIVDSYTIDVGTVPVYQSETAIFELSNSSTQDLLIESIEVVDHSGELFTIVDFDREEVSRRGDAWVIKANGGTTQLHVIYAPTLVGNQDFVTLRINSNAKNEEEDYPNGRVELTVRGVGGTPVGAPDIEVAYNAYVGPDAADCATRFEGDTAVIENDDEGNPIINICRLPTALDFGNIGLSAQGTVRLRLRNKAECPVFPGAAECASCALVVAKDETRENIGLGFRPGSNDSGVFSFAGSTATPFTLRQKDIDCGEDGEVPLSVEFHAPATEGLHTAFIVIESNDPDEPLLEIPVRGYARNAPIAVAKLREYDATNPSAPYNEDGQVAPLERGYFDGRESYDPADPQAPLTYNWSVIDYPQGADTSTFDMNGTTSALMDMFFQIPGHYVLQLKVKNSSGIESGDTPESRVELDVIPDEKMHVQLIWDDTSNDMDLHLTMASSPGDDRICGPWDVHWRKQQPVWFSSDPSGEGPNPRLDIDDVFGLGPENINIDDPLPGTYRVYVHHFASESSNTRCTIRIFLNGVQRAEYRRTLQVGKTVWAVGEIVWAPDDVGSVTPYPSDAAGEIGSVAVMNECSDPGWLFP